MDPYAGGHWAFIKGNEEPLVNRLFRARQALCGFSFSPSSWFDMTFRKLRGIVLAVFVGLVQAEDGLAGWLRYAPLPSSSGNLSGLPSSIVALNSTKTSPVYTAGQELHKGIAGILGKQLDIGSSSASVCNQSGSVVVGTVQAFAELCGGGSVDPAAKQLDADGFWLDIRNETVHVLGQNERGALYGAFEYLSMLAQGNLSRVSYATNPNGQIRWVNEWDNLDGSIERGYGGPSIFFKDGLVASDLSRAAEYARLLASIRVNGIIVNNVNANATLLSPQNMQGLGRLADVFRPYGIRLGISLNFASPTSIGGLKTFDPLDASVIAFWTNITEQLYQRVPDMAGFLVKANSEGQPGPLTYNRTLADGANLFAKALQPHGGILMFRAFVYDQLNESNWKADRANAAVDFFKDLDGKFDDNVVIQIKYGPIDFQVREPASPLFANLAHTSTAIELQVTQEYLGQQCHLMYLPPLWKTVLDFDMRVDDKPSLVRDIISGRRFKRPLGGSAAVVNVGTNTTWLGSHMAMSNLYAYGRMAWDPTEGSERIVEAWTRLTFGHDRAVVDTIRDMSMQAWPAYENYSGNLGIQTLTDILYTHFGPNPASQDNNGWGQWTRADARGIGMDRTVANGTGFAGQYPPAVAARYEKVETTPDELLLWFHHVPYNQTLRSGKTVIQHFYDAHYDGAAVAQTFVSAWKTLQGKMDAQRYADVLYRLVFQAGHAIVWRDAISGYYHTLSGVPDAAGRVGNHPCRFEAEGMELDGYQPYQVTPSEMASGGFAVVTASNNTAATASMLVRFPSGVFDVSANYFDMAGGRSHWTLQINNRTVGQWVGNNEDTLGHAPSVYLDGHSATRITFHDVRVETGDDVRIIGTPDGKEPAPLDYIQFAPPGKSDC